MNTALRSLGLLLVLVGSALAGTRDPSTPDEKYVEFGQKFPSVLRIRATITGTDSKYPYQYGSAVAIRPHWVLTAAHVLDKTEDPRAFNTAHKEFALGPVFTHHEFFEETIGFHDIALCYSPDDLGV